MWWRKKEETVVEHPKVRTRIIKEWNDDRAEYVYALYKYGLVHFGLHTGTWHDWERDAYGDKEWAERNAKHYSIEIEEE